ncbi:hypothetical protein QUF64_05795 [Anaerolineales bacterium HSG6]|nr:hypothetical protein [Anaerolineales bacterium HSG6]
MIDYTKMFKLESQFVLNEQYLKLNEEKSRRVVALLTNDLWPVSYGPEMQFSFLHQADKIKFVSTVQWAKAVIKAQDTDKMEDYAFLYDLVIQRVARFTCLCHYAAFMLENDTCRDDVAHLRWVVEAPVVELVVWLGAAKGLWEWE